MTCLLQPSKMAKNLTLKSQDAKLCQSCSRRTATPGTEWEADHHMVEVKEEATAVPPETAMDPVQDLVVPVAVVALIKVEAVVHREIRTHPFLWETFLIPHNKEIFSKCFLQRVYLL